MKLVLDTNVLIAAFISKGVCHHLVEHCLRLHQSLTSEFILDEVREKLTKKFKYSEEDAIAVIALLRSRMEVIAPITLTRGICRDPDDEMVLATAVAGEAVCIITGDRDLLVLEQFESIDILSPSQFASYEGDRE